MTSFTNISAKEHERLAAVHLTKSGTFRSRKKKSQLFFLCKKIVLKDNLAFFSFGVFFS